MTTTIYLIRHGEVHNPQGILYGRLSGYGLSAKGKNEIEQTAEFLNNTHIDLIFSSPLLRTKQTAEIIRSKLKLNKIYFSKSLLEVKTSYQGRFFAELSPDQSEAYFLPQPTDETLEQVAKRLHLFKNHIIKNYRGKNIVAVSHGDPLMLFRAVESGLPIKFESIREEGGFSYMKHGEVLELSFSDHRKTRIESLFKPVVK